MKKTKSPRYAKHEPKDLKLIRKGNEIALKLLQSKDKKETKKLLTHLKRTTRRVEKLISA